MTLLTALTETLLYFCFSLLVGGALLAMLPATVKPAYHLPKGIYLSCLYGVAIFSFGPVFLLWYTITLENPGMVSLANLLFSVEIGQTWLIMAFSAVLLALLLVFNDITTSKKAASLALIWSLFLIVIYTWVGHAASLSILGFVSHALHLVAVSIWVGILLVITWFSTNEANWSAFLRWYTPLSIACVSLVLLAGLMLMQWIVPEYWNSWLLPYGEALLVKHLLFAVLISIAVVNAFLLRKNMHRSWLKIETILILLIFLVTGWMGQQTPPHEVMEVLQTEPISPLITLFSQFGEPHPVTLNWNTPSIMLTVLATLCILAMIVSFRKKRSPLFYLFFGICWTVTTFLAVITAIQ